MEQMRKLIFILNFIFIVCASALEFNELPILSGSAGVPWENYRQDTPPFFGAVRVSKEEPMTLQVTVYEDEQRFQGQVLDLVGRIKQRDVEEELFFETEDGRVFQTLLPETIHPGEAELFLEATDTAGNRVLFVPELPDAEKIPKLQSWVTDEDAEESVLESSLDILEVRGAITKKFIYLQYILEGPYSKGTLDPPYILGQGGIIWGRNDLQNIFAAVSFLFAPLFSFDSFPTHFLYDLSTASPYYSSAFTVSTRENTITFRIPREIVGYGGKGYKMVFGNLAFLRIKVRDDTTADSPNPKGVMDLFEKIVREWRLRQVIPLEEIEALRTVYHFTELTPFIRVLVGPAKVNIPE